MTDPNTASARVHELADEFLERYRRGQRPSLAEYTARYPDLAEEIREVFPAVAIMERIALDDELIAGEAAARDPAPVPAPGSGSSATTGSSARSATAGWAWSTRPSSSAWAGTWR